MSVSQDIRGALQTRAATAVGFPPAGQRAYEGMTFTSTVGTPWARMTLIQKTGRPFALNAADTQHRGLFQVDVLVPAGQGTGAAEMAADAVKSVFRAGTRLVQNGETVLIDYSERAPAVVQPDWIFYPITIAWRCFSANN